MHIIDLFGKVPFLLLLHLRCGNQGLRRLHKTQPQQELIDMLIHITAIFRDFSNAVVTKADYRTQRETFASFSQKIFNKLTDKRLESEIILTKNDSSRLQNAIHQSNDRVLTQRAIQSLAMKVIEIGDVIFRKLIRDEKKEDKAALIKVAYKEFIDTLCDVGLKFKHRKTEGNLDELWFQSARTKCSDSITEKQICLQDVDRTIMEIEQMDLSLRQIEDERMLIEEYAANLALSNNLILQQQQQIELLQRMLQRRF